MKSNVPIAYKRSSAIKFPFKKLLKWFYTFERHLPWREDNPDPYQVWISEVMSQQSTMPTVIPYFKRWMNHFPTLEKLVQASEEELLHMWQGLGYYSRARNVLKTAHLLSSRLKEKNNWPESYHEWIKFPGVGNYTAKAITSICFKEKVLPIDGNVIRVFSRYFLISDPLNQNKDLEKIHQAVQDLEVLVPLGKHGDVAQALMDLGSQICRPKESAQCQICPIKKDCAAFKKNAQSQYPQTKKRKETLKLFTLALLYTDKRGRYLMRQIPPGGRLAGQWEFPHLQLENWSEGFQKKLQRHFELWGPVAHSITHHNYTVFLLNCGQWKGAIPSEHDFFQVDFKGISAQLTTLSRKLIKIVDKSRS